MLELFDAVIYTREELLTENKEQVRVYKCVFSFGTYLAEKGNAQMLGKFYGLRCPTSKSPSLLMHRFDCVESGAKCSMFSVQ